MKKIKSIFATVLVLTVILGMEVLGETIDDIFYLPVGNYHEIIANKSTDLDYFGYRLKDVYPADFSEDDTYTRMKIAAVTRNNNAIVSTRVITESTTTSTIPALQDLSTADYILVHLSGNNPSLDAYADIFINIY